MKLLTIWIPTYRRPQALAALLDNLERTGLTQLAEVIVSDNDPHGSNPSSSTHGEFSCSPDIAYRRNVANLSAGVNFLKGFEVCRTPWLMIVGDDDLFSPDAASTLHSLINSMPLGVIAIKFDSTLFGHQQFCRSTGLVDYVDQLDACYYAEAFNNICLVSNWLFRSDSCRPHLASAYLGYSSKLSHLFPLLRACTCEGGQILFLPSQLVLHGSTEMSSWPKAATWYEMVMTITNFTGFIDSPNRNALLRLLFHSDWRRTIAKCLRVHQFYGRHSEDVKEWRVHIHLASCSFTYFCSLLLVLPLLLLPPDRLPRRLLKQLGDPGCVERW